MLTLHSKIRTWLEQKPGMFEAVTPQECLRKAWAASGVECSVEDFRAALNRVGFRPEVVRNRYRLALPAHPVEGENPYRALRNIPG